MVRILNVAEKNDAAKNLAEILSRGGYQRKDGLSVYNKIYEFEMVLQGQRVQMVMTSVSGHLLTHSFIGHYKKWTGCNPLELFDAPVRKVCPENMRPIKETLERESRYASRLIIWTDCDREGENIGFEIISVCKGINSNLHVSRAKFSEITFQSVNRAIQNLGVPDSKQNDAVEVRSELDLRIGAAFTRFQTLRLKKVFPEVLAETLISYGSCQFPTLGFVVERYKAIEEFVPEQFWKIKVTHVVNDCRVDFLWKRVRLFNETACQVLHEKCTDSPVATVTNVKSKMKSKWRPLPLDTIEFEKLSSRKLKINAKESMRIAEKLYTAGLISYPRTETNIFPKELNLRPLVQIQMEDQNWGDFAQRVFNNGPTPRQGRKSDQAHPPIHPTKYTNNLQGNEYRIYEFIVRHFLACCDKDAKGTETIVNIDIAGEQFSASGLIILERNYLLVYPYEKWSDKEMPQYEQNQQFEPTTIELVDGQTTPPPLLTEADLITLMEKHGIGTDATHAEHIEKIKSRLYVGLQDARFIPGELGMGLVEGYDAMGFHMSKPDLRAELEADLKRICEGTKDPNLVLREQVEKYRNVFQESLRQASNIDKALAKYLNEVPQPTPQEVAIPDVPDGNAFVMKCPSCGLNIVVKSKRDNKGLYLSCLGFPDCKVALWFPDPVKQVEILEEHCEVCTGSPKKMKFTFAPHSYTPILPREYITCIGGCDTHFLQTLDIQPLKIKQPANRERSSSNPSFHGDSGYSSSNSNFVPNHSNQSRVVFSNRTNSNLSFDGSRSNTAGSDFGNNDNWNSSQMNRFPKNSAPASNFNSGASQFPSTSNSNHRERSLPSFLRTPSSSNPNTTNGKNSWVGNRSDSFGNFGDEGGEGNAIVCNCNEDAIKLTVRKEGPNTGRQFYRCKKNDGQGKCNFFLWADDDGENMRKTTNSNPSGSSFTSGNWNSTSTSSSDNGFSSSFHNSSAWQNTEDTSDFSADRVTCNCGTDAKRLTTMKEGANKGREFYVCPKIREEQCGYFQWVDELGTPQNSRGSGRGYFGGSNFESRGTGRRGRGSSQAARGGVKRKANEGDTLQKRKCGVCGGEGHDRRNCPHN